MTGLLGRAESFSLMTLAAEGGTVEETTTAAPGARTGGRRDDGRNEFSFSFPPDRE